MDAAELTKPTLHLNGTSARELADKYADAMRAIETAKDAIAETCPNARDYYPQSPEANTKARAEHCRRLEALETLRDEMEALALHCIDNDPRNARTASA